MPRHDIELIEAISKALSDTARAVAEGMGEGIAKAMGYGLVVQPPAPVDEPKEEVFFPDVELDGRWINPDIGDGNV